MKKRLLAALCVLPLLFAFSCSMGTVTKGKTLIVYYSVTGNTDTVAKAIHEAVGGDIFRIETVTPYGEDIREVAKTQIEHELFPEIAPVPFSAEDYDIIFIGSPTWYGTLAAPVQTFLIECDLSNKTVVPFSTYGGSAGTYVSDIEMLCSYATVLEGLAVRGSDVSEKTIAAWLKRISIR